MNNSALRKKSFALYKTYWKTLVLVTLFAASPTFIVALIMGFLNFPAVVRQIITFIVGVLFYPVTVGAVHVYLRTWRGGTPDFKMVFHFCQPRGLWLKTLVLGLLYMAAPQILFILYYLSTFPINHLPVMVAILSITFVFSVFAIWMYLRLALLPYLYSMQYATKSAWEVFKESMRRMKGNIGSYIWLLLTVSWWMLFFVAALLVFIDLASYETMAFIREHTDVFRLFILPGFLLVTLLFFPYLNLVTAGFANGCIPTEREIRRADQKMSLPNNQKQRKK